MTTPLCQAKRGRGRGFRRRGFQSVHMHRHVVACSIDRVEQSFAAPGFAHKQPPRRRRR